MESVYLDSASSEPLHPAAREALLAALDRGYADPRRLHGPGRDARLLLDNAREVVAQCLGVRPDEVVFTGSGTEAVHRGLLGLLAGRRRHGRGVAHSAVEHSAVLHAVRWAGSQGTVLPVDRHGRLRLELLGPALRGSGGEAEQPVAVLALQAANHEVGTLQPVAEAAQVAGDIPLFMDACALAGRLPLPDGWAGAAASAHKWGGPAGVGVLLLRKGVRWRQPFPVDDRMDDRAGGFENVPAALGAAAALQAVVAERESVAARQAALVERLRQGAAQIADVEIAGDASRRLPHLVTFSCLYVDGEALVTELDRLGYGVASGSACTASTLEPSHVLSAMGVLTHGNVRVSLTWTTTAAEVDGLLGVLPGVVAELRARIGLPR